jgi:hypothetical protein
VKKRKIVTVLIGLVVVLLGLGAGGYFWLERADAAFHAAADAKRVYDVHRIAAMAEAYRALRGYYPLADRVATLDADGPIPVAVNITNLELDPIYGSPPPGRRGVVLPFEELLGELRAVLGNDLVVPFDPQKVPTGAPNFYQYMTNGTDYFVSANLNSPTPYTQEIGPRYHKYQVSSTSAPGYAVRRFQDIPWSELEAARQAGEAAARSFWYLEEEVGRLQEGG